MTKSAGSLYPSECIGIRLRTHRSAQGLIGPHLRPIQHPSGGRGAHSDRNCVRFSTHRGVRTPVFDVPKKIAQQNTLVFSDFDVPKFGTAKIGATRQPVSVPLRFRRRRPNKNQQTRAATAPMPSAAGIFCRDSCRGGTNGAQMGRMRFKRPSWSVGVCDALNSPLSLVISRRP